MNGHRLSDHGSYEQGQHAGHRGLAGADAGCTRHRASPDVTNSKLGFEDTTISIAETFSGSLNAVLRQLEKMRWVATPQLC